MRDYSQFGEQAHILKFFEERGRTKGRFLDIGAHDGISCSNSLALAERGWGGALVEPSPLAFSKLITTYAERPDIALVNAAAVPMWVDAAGSLGARRGPHGLMPFYEAGGLFVGTTSPEHVSAWEGKQHVHYRKMWLHALPLVTLICTDFAAGQEGPAGIARPMPQWHFISIDTEGTNCALLDDLLSLYTRASQAVGLELVCVEKDPGIDDIVKKYEVDVYAETAANLLLSIRQ
jgi:hypothetical protein